MAKDALNSKTQHEHSPPTGEKQSESNSSDIIEELTHHKIYFDYINNQNPNNKPSFIDIKDYLRDAYLGLVPIPLNTENLSKSYAYFSGSCHKKTINKILSKKDLAFNLIPALNELENKEKFDLSRFKNYICQPETQKSEGKLKRLIHFNNQKAKTALVDMFQNPSIVTAALKSVSKKQWGQLLVKPPTNTHLLKATSKLSSDEFFKNGMHLAFLEIEPEIYGVLTKAAASTKYQGFKAQKYIRLTLELELNLRELTSKQLSEEKFKADAKRYKNNKDETTIRENEIRSTNETPKTTTKLSLDLPKERPSFIQKVVREELGYDIPINRLQVERILEAADAILKEPKKDNGPIDYLHSKHPDAKKEEITFDNMDLSR